MDDAFAVRQREAPWFTFDTESRFSSRHCEQCENLVRRSFLRLVNLSLPHSGAWRRESRRVAGAALGRFRPPAKGESSCAAGTEFTAGGLDPARKASSAGSGDASGTSGDMGRSRPHSLHQLSRVIAHQYRDAVGPWSAYLGVLQCTGHSAP
jgi:hypothetical protein